MNFILYGFRGFIGTNIKKKLGSENLICLNSKNLEKKKIKPNKVYSLILASGTSSVIKAQLNPTFDYEKNVKNLDFFLKFLKKNKIQINHIIYLSTASVVGNKMTKITERDKYNPISVYAKNKMLSEILLKKFSKKNNIKLSIFRIFTVYGTNIKKQFLWDLALKIKKRKNDSIELFGSGKEIKDYFLVDDLIKCIILCFKMQKKNFEVFNISSGKKVSIEEIVKFFLNELKLKKIKIVYNNKHSNIFPRKMISDNRKFNNFFKIRPSDFKSGLKKYIRWLKIKKYV